MSAFHPLPFISLLLITLLGGCATLERNKEETRALAEGITLYIDTALIQRQDRGDNTLTLPRNESMAQRIEQRVRQRLSERGYRLSEVFTSVGAAPDEDLPATVQPLYLSPLSAAQRDTLLQLHQSAARTERQLPPALLQQATGEGVMVVLIHGSMKSPFELHHEEALNMMHEMLGHSVDEIARHLGEGHYRLALYRKGDGRLVWNNWGEDLLHDQDELLWLIEPAIGSLP